MKRSEMVELVAKRLGPIGICDETCSEVLKIMEEAGMLPPRVELSNMPGVFDNAWEVEDENKSSL